MIALTAEADRTWMADAACRTGHAPDLWYPTAGLPDPLAVHICAGCPVRQNCENYANTHREQHGVWGGLTTDQRNRRARIREAQR